MSETILPALLDTSYTKTNYILENQNITIQSHGMKNNFQKQSVEKEKSVFLQP